MKVTNPLQRGKACLSCRKRKMVSLSVSVPECSVLSFTLPLEMRWGPSYLLTMRQGKQREGLPVPRQEAGQSHRDASRKNGEARGASASTRE